jgi:DNA repair exonuclease SbcCD ATPase subunit
MRNAINGSSIILSNLTVQDNNMCSAYNQVVDEFHQATRAKYENEILHINKARDVLNDRKQTHTNMKAAVNNANIELANKQNSMALYESRVQMSRDRLKELQDRTIKHAQYIGMVGAEERTNTSLKYQLTHMRWVDRNLRKVKLDEYTYVIERLNQILAEEMMKVWGSGISVRFVNAKEKATGGVKAELGLIVTTPNKDGVPVEMYSGGQRKALVIAVFRAIRRLMNERGKGVNISAIDEIDKDLDEQHIDRLVDALENVVADSPTCLIISHNSRLLNTMKFDGIWSVNMENEMSTITTGV